MKLIKILALIFSVLICTSCTPSPAFAYTLQGTVVYVYDGDTILLKEADHDHGVTSALEGRHRVRLASIDAPEKDQPYGIESTLLLRKLLQNNTVLANIIDIDKYGRKIAYVHINDHLHCPLGNSDISSLMLANGAAWHYKAFDKTSAQYDMHYALEQQARANKRGLWAQENPIAPWVWRKQSSQYTHGKNQ